MSARTLGMSLLVLLCALRAGADEPERRARAHYEAGRALYTLGDYEQALHEFVAGYQLSARPEFLLNAGQALRRLERLDEAEAMFEKYLKETPPNDAKRAQVGELLEELKHHRAEVRPPPPAVAPVAPAPPPFVATPSPLPDRRSFLRRHWWIFPVGAVVLAGAAVGLYFALRPGVDCSATPLGCLDASHAQR
jgi:tetratricopeptide (TPR) repeat protein